MAPPTLVDAHLRFRYDEDDPAVTGVALECDRALPGPRELRRDGRGWVLDLPRPALDRVEYRLAVRRGEHTDVVLDPANPTTVPTAFGDRSVLELPGYTAPWWLGAPAVPGRLDPMALAGETADEVPVTIWSPESLDPDTPAPLLLVHDGPEYDLLAGITTYAGALVAAGALPPHRVALTHPVLRDAWYSGSPRYLRTVAEAGLDRIGDRYATAGPVVVMGASLGGLTALLAGPPRGAPGGRRPGPVGLVLPGAPRRRREQLPVLRTDLAGGAAGARHAGRRAPARRRDDVRGPGGERCEQPRHGGGAAAGRAPTWPTARWPTSTTTPPGGTRSTRSSPRSSGRRGAPGPAGLTAASPSPRVGSHGAAQRPARGARPRDRARGRPPRPLGPAGAAVPVGGRARRTTPRATACSPRWPPSSMPAGSACSPSTPSTGGAWSDTSLPTEERARRGALYTAWLSETGDPVDPVGVAVATRRSSPRGPRSGPTTRSTSP